MDTSPTVHQQNTRLRSQFTGFVVREHFVSDERGRSASTSNSEKAKQSSPAMAASQWQWKTLGQKFSHHYRQPCSYHSVRMTTGLPVTACGPPEKKMRPDRRRETTASCSSIAIAIDATIEMNTHRATAEAPRPTEAANVQHS